MKVYVLPLLFLFWISIFSMDAQTNERYIEVTGT